MKLAPLYETGTSDQLLESLCEAIQLSQTQYDNAVQRYGSVSSWLLDGRMPYRRTDPHIIPQGSMLQRTTNRPYRLNDDTVPFDLDSVSRYLLDPTKTNSKEVYDATLNRLRENETYKRLIDEAKEYKAPSGKCITLAYRDDFLLEVVPTCIDPTDDEGIRLLMCNPKFWSASAVPKDTWRHTDPFRFAEWLDVRASMTTLLEKRAIQASAAPVPPKEPAAIKAVLRRVVQLMKRARDIEFMGENCRPTSILLTTLAGDHYGGEQSIVLALRRILDGIGTAISQSGSKRIVVINPADRIKPHPSGEEDLIAAMDDRAYSMFRKLIDSMRSMLDQTQSLTGPKLLKRFGDTFGHGSVQAASRKIQDEVRDASKSGLMGASTTGSGITILTDRRATPSFEPTRPNTFHSAS